MTAAAGHAETDQVAMEQALLSSDLVDKVELVLRKVGQDRYRVASRYGAVIFAREPVSRTDDDETYPGVRLRGAGSPEVDYRLIESTGRNPLADMTLDADVTLSLEQQRHASGEAAGSYPNAFESVSQFFDSPDAPELFVSRTGGFDEEGNSGSHGSLGVIQARALLIASGAGVAQSAVPSGAERTVDVAPTIAALLGLEARQDGSYLRAQDGRPLAHMLTTQRADHVVVLLLDGCNTNLLVEVVASGDAPNLASLIDQGTFARNGMTASLPTATLANHTAAVTGLHPGHSGILNHTWLKRSTAEVPELLSMEQMFWATTHLRDGVETIFEVIAAQRPESYTTATFEFCDRGASMSTFAMVRDGAARDLPDLSECRHVNPAAATEDGYRFYSMVDHMGMLQTLESWEQTSGNPLPTLSWCSFALTDEAGHRSGPHGDLARQAIIDTDGRVGEILRAVDAAGVLGTTAFLVISDHGMEQTNPAITGDWHSVLAQTSVRYRDIGQGLIYLGD